jgi:hypothetical protein
MAFELLTVLLGACVGALAVLYAAPKGYFGHKRMRYTAPTTSIEPVVSAPPEPAPEVKPIAPQPAPEPAPAFTAAYETVQPPPAPVTYAAPSPASFGASSAPTFSKKPVRTYRRRTAPVRSHVPAKVAKAKSKKR